MTNYKDFGNICNISLVLTRLYMKEPSLQSLHYLSTNCHIKVPKTFSLFLAELILQYYNLQLQQPLLLSLT